MIRHKDWRYYWVKGQRLWFALWFNETKTHCFRCLSPFDPGGSLCYINSSVDCLSCSRKQTQMAGSAYCIFPSGLWETSTCQAFPIPPDVSAWQNNTTNYTDPSLGLQIPFSLERTYLGRAQTFSLLMSTAHLLFFYRAFIACIAKYSHCHPIFSPTCPLIKYL